MLVLLSYDVHRLKKLCHVLGTQQRGKNKQGNFAERLRKMRLKEERPHNPLAKGLPYPTDEPEVCHANYIFSNFIHSLF
jgi:hypothetical protein